MCGKSNGRHGLLVRRSAAGSAGRLLFSLLLLADGSIAHGQDSVRPSLAGEATAEARQQDVNRTPYNLLVGPVQFRLSATVGVEYNDNVNLAEVGAQSDFIIQPNVSIDAIWPITQLNTLRLDLGLGYAFYLDHSNYDSKQVLIAPNSQIAFDFFIGDFRINLHDRMQLQQDPIEEAALSNVAHYSRFENTAGVSVLWDLNRLQLTLGYDHYNFISNTTEFDYLDRHAETVMTSANVIITPTISVGFEGTSVFNYYDSQVELSDSVDYSAGAFVEAGISNNLRVRLAAGAQWINFDRNFVNFAGLVFMDHGHLASAYANGLLTHRLNNVITQTVSAGHESQLGVDSNFITLNYVRHTVTWNVLRNTLLNSEFFFEDAKESGGPINEHFHRIGGALTAGYQLTPHVTLGCRYQITSKDSNAVLRDYNQNRVSVDATYSF